MYSIKVFLIVFVSYQSHAEQKFIQLSGKKISQFSSLSRKIILALFYHKIHPAKKSPLIKSWGSWLIVCWVLVIRKFKDKFWFQIGDSKIHPKANSPIEIQLKFINFNWSLYRTSQKKSIIHSMAINPKPREAHTRKYKDWKSLEILHYLWVKISSNNLQLICIAWAEKNYFGYYAWVCEK